MAELYRFRGRLYVIRHCEIRGIDVSFRVTKTGRECFTSFAADVVRAMGQRQGENRPPVVRHRDNGAALSH